MTALLTFATVQVGQHFGTHVWHATSALAQRWSEAFVGAHGATADTAGAMADGAAGVSPDTASAAPARLPAAFAFVYTSEAVLSLMPPKAEGGIHAKQAFTFGCAVHVGDTLRTELFVQGKYEKRGRLYVELSTRTLNQHGQLVLEALRTTIWAE